MTSLGQERTGSRLKGLNETRRSFGLRRGRLIAIEVVGYPPFGLAASVAFERHLYLALGLAYSAPGILLILRGSLALFFYLRQNPLPQS